jgi:abhydrolase domain-containing protein 13
MIPCSDGVHIHAWLMQAPIAEWTKAPTIIFFHGNAGNIGLRLPNALQMLQYLNVNVLLVEYRGYGNSDSVTPTESGLKLDAQGALQFAIRHANIDSSKLFIFGRSLGGAVAFHLAEYAAQQSTPIAGVITENTFTSISSMVDHLMPFLTPIKPFVLKIGWNSGKIVPTLTDTPMLFLVGAKDELVPPTHSRDLYTAATKSSAHNLVQMHVIADGTHNESWTLGGPEYWDAIRAFMSAALLRQSSDVSATARISSQNARPPLDAYANAGAPSSSGIPIMSTRFVDIAKDAFAGGARDSTNGVKKEL